MYVNYLKIAKTIQRQIDFILAIFMPHVRDSQRKVATLLEP
jgi:hypothetical protein